MFRWLPSPVALERFSFRVIAHSVKKTDPNDARNLALYLEKDLLPEVRMKDPQRAQIASLTQTRDTMVKLRTALKNKINNLVSAQGINLSKESLASEKGLAVVLKFRFEALVELELKTIVGQIRSLNGSIAELEEPLLKKGRSWRGTPLLQCEEAEERSCVEQCCGHEHFRFKVRFVLVEEDGDEADQDAYDEDEVKSV
jgi:hypothetical protein